jgi:EAL domain-containing protein (putative c-di-GMP-specific phosphodiesterase class I)
LGKGFNLRVVAEGVETQAQVEILRRLNCQQMQGFWFGRPLEAEEASKFLQLNYSEKIEGVQEAEESVSSEQLPK